VLLGTFWGCQPTFCSSQIEASGCGCSGAKVFATGGLGLGLAALQGPWAHPSSSSSSSAPIFISCSQSPDGWTGPIRAARPGEQHRPSTALAEEGQHPGASWELVMCIGEPSLPKTSVQAGMNSRSAASLAGTCLEDAHPVPAGQRVRRRGPLPALGTLGKCLGGSNPPFLCSAPG